MAIVAFWFQAAYGLGYVLFGRVVDRFGAKVGARSRSRSGPSAHMAHALVTSTARLHLGAHSHGDRRIRRFPFALAATGEWFPKRERALAIGIFNAGSNVGAILAPFIVPIITIALGWQMAFILTGLLTFVWLAVWLIWYRRPRAACRASAPRNWPISNPTRRRRSARWPGRGCSPPARPGPISWAAS